MKYTTIILMLTLPYTAYTQVQENVTRQKELDFEVSIQGTDEENKTEAGKYFNLIISADRESIQTAERVYIRVTDMKTGENQYVKAIDKKVLTGVTTSEQSISMVHMDKERVLLIFGPFERGKYYVYVKIRDDKNNMYFKRRKVSI